MARPFLGFGEVPFIGQPSLRAVKIFGIAGQTVPLIFPWLAYGASSAIQNINVAVSLEGKVVSAKFDQVRSVYIDNLGSDTPVYVNFPDTAYTVVAKPNSEGWYPVYSNSLKFNVVGLGFVTGAIPTTIVIPSNVALPPNVNTELDQGLNLWLASATISRGTTIYNRDYGVPALGDQTLQARVALNGLSSTTLFNSPLASGFIYLTAISVEIIGTNEPAATGQVGQIFIESTGLSGVLFNLQYFAVPLSQNPPGAGNLLELAGLNIKLAANELWRLRNGISVNSGVCQVSYTFTTNPK